MSFCGPLTMFLNLVSDLHVLCVTFVSVYYVCFCVFCLFLCVSVCFVFSVCFRLPSNCPEGPCECECFSPLCLARAFYNITCIHLFIHSLKWFTVSGENDKSKPVEIPPTIRELTNRSSTASSLWKWSKFPTGNSPFSVVKYTNCCHPVMPCWERGGNALEASIYLVSAYGYGYYGKRWGLERMCL